MDKKIKKINIDVEISNLNCTKLIATKRNITQQELINQFIEEGLNNCPEIKIVRELEKI